MEADRYKGLLQALMAVKNTPRTGWLLRGVPAAIAETIAAHGAEASVLALVIAEELGADPYRAAAIASVHDLGEAFIGDLVKRATDAIGKKLKEDIELRVAAEEFGENSIVFSLIREYIEQATPEARVAKLAEQLSTLLQALRYHRQGWREVDEIMCSMLNSLSKAQDEELDALYRVAGRALNEARQLCSQEQG